MDPDKKQCAKGRRRMQCRLRNITEDEQKIDEVLESIWNMREESEYSFDELMKRSDVEDINRVINCMTNKGLITIDENKIKFTEEGDERAKQLIRRHRLAEVLFTEVFDISDEYIESNACEFEHILSSEVIDSICTFLGHPPLCPHGKPIPRGGCCAIFRKEMKPLVVPLTELEVGGEGKIVYLTPKYHSRFDRLSSFGIVPGRTVKIHQRQPSYVIKTGETEIAIDSEIAGEIFVKKV